MGLEARPRDVKAEPKPLLALTVGAGFHTNKPEFQLSPLCREGSRPLSIPVLPNHFPLNIASALKHSHATGLELSNTKFHGTSGCFSSA